MQIYTFELAHPSHAMRPAIATLAAESRHEAELLVNREFAKVLNVKFVRAADLPAGQNFRRVITVQGPDGQIVEKAF
jgi:hypothetical protein